MSIENFKAFSQACFRDCPPPCSCACPLGVDVRAVMDKVQKKNFTSAYRLYRNHVLFPAIVSAICHEPCREACVRRGAGQEILLRSVEAACVAHTKNAAPISFNVPAKPYTVAVIGAGLSGLSCALKLASRNYGVLLYDREEQPGGSLHHRMPEEVYLKEIDRQFSEVECNMHFSTEVKRLDSLKADATYVATGKGGEDFGLLEGLDVNSLGSAQTGVFVGGEILGCNPIEAIEHGIRASYSIEKFLQGGAMDGMPETYMKPQVRQAFYQMPLPFAPTAMEEGETCPEAVQAESLRCLRCNCSLCHDQCDLMQTFRSYPPKMVQDTISSMGPRENITQRVGMKMLNSCLQCGLCKKVCPENVDMEQCLLEARRSLHLDKALPPAYHDFWLRDMEFSNGPAALLYKPYAGHSVEYLFFPGCQLGASDPAYVTASCTALLTRYHSTALLLGCCGVPAEWAGNESLRDTALDLVRETWLSLGKPQLVLACPTCRKTFSRYFPEARSISLFQLLAGMPDLPHSSDQPCRGHDISVYDPCSSRDDPGLQKDIRELVVQMGLTVHELPVGGPLARCCGFGGQVHAVRPEFVREVAAQRAALAEREYITYCTNCRDSFALSGKPCRHILDLLFTGNSPFRRPPTISERRRNRLWLRNYYENIGGQPRTPQPQGGPDMQIAFTQQLKEKMQWLLILEEEVAQVIDYCERTGKKVFNPATGRFTGHKSLGLTTCWVEYGTQDGAIIVYNVYNHRMTIEDSL